MSSPAIEINALTKTFRGKKLQKVEALLSLDLAVERGQVFGFLGPNGAGKSTTIKILTNQIRATSGLAAIFGVQVGTAAARQHLGYLPENPSFFDFLTAREYLRFVAQVFNMDSAELNRELDRVLDVMDLFAAADRPLKTYSKGMVQRLGLAQALLHNPELYILDEPMSGLDPIGRALVKDVILDLKRKGKTVFFSTHITNDVETVCDHFAILNKGRLMAVDSVSVALGGNKAASYEVCYRDLNASELFLEVESSNLSATLASLQEQGCSILRAAQQRHTMEDYFLSKIGKDNTSHE